MALGTVLAQKAVTPLSEGVLSLVAAVLVISMVIYMLKAAKHMRRDIGAKLEAAVRQLGQNVNARLVTEVLALSLPRA